MDPQQSAALEVRRRSFLGFGVSGLGLFALNVLFNPRLFASESQATGGSRGVVNPLHFPPKAKRVIFLYQAGGPSHLETFDPKPKLLELDGKPMPESFTKGQQLAQLQGKKLVCFGPQHGFKKFGKSGLEICELFPRIGSVADDICIVRSMTTEQINHDPAHTVMNTGMIIAGRPSMGSWVLYGLGSEAQDLPGFIVVVSSGKGGQMQPIAARQWSSGFLPSRFQGVKFNSIGDPVLYIKNPQGVDTNIQADSIQAINGLNQIEYGTVKDPEVLTRIAQYEMAFKMQASVPGLMDMSQEPKHILDLYGAKPGDGSFASNCLLARRLAERGVRFIQLYHRDWDHHGGIKANIAIKAQETDRATAALITDLKQRGMLKDTLVIWGGEFGRTPHVARRRWARPSHQRVLVHARRWRYQRWTRLRGHRRTRLCGCREPRECARFSRHRALSTGHRPQPLDGEVPRSGRSAHIRLWRSGKRDSGLGPGRMLL
jgi:hypothetical protein